LSSSKNEKSTGLENASGVDLLEKKKPKRELEVIGTGRWYQSRK